MPPWVQEGGYEAWADAAARSGDSRARGRRDEDADRRVGELLHGCRKARSSILLVGFKNDALKPLTGKTLAEVARMRGKSPEETAMDLVIEDGSRVGTVYFLMSEDNVRRQMHVAVGELRLRRGGARAGRRVPEVEPASAGLRHVSRVCSGRYARDEKILTLADAIRRLTATPGREPEDRSSRPVEAGFFADVVVFDPATINDHATFDKPHQYATGMRHVFVNGVQVLRDGEHTGAKPGRVVRGPGWRGK